MQFKGSWRIGVNLCPANFSLVRNHSYIQDFYLDKNQCRNFLYMQTDGEQVSFWWSTRATYWRLDCTKELVSSFSKLRTK